MNPEIKAQWLAALRSGEYRQGKHVLHNVDENTYCCLGVLCDLAVKAAATVADETVYNGTITGEATKFGQPDENACADGVTVLPYAVMEWAGISSENPWTSEAGESELAQLNDDYDYKFPQLADVIERDL